MKLPQLTAFPFFVYIHKVFHELLIYNVEYIFVNTQILMCRRDTDKILTPTLGSNVHSVD